MYRCETRILVDPLTASSGTVIKPFKIAKGVPLGGAESTPEYANSVDYGLSATIWTKDITRANRMAEQIQAGVVWINCWLLRDLRTPFGGVKNSGVGREGALEALRFFTEPKNICVKY